MDAPTAALIGAGVASVVSLFAQFLAHVLSIKRDRRNQRRQRLSEVITIAGTALYEPIDKPPSFDDEPPPNPDSIAALHPHLQDPAIRHFMDSFGRAITLLQVHLGHNHPLIDAYSEAFKSIATSLEAKALHTANDDEQSRIDNIPQLAKVLRDAQNARDEWTQLARRYVEAI